MDLVVLTETETPFALRALRDVVASNGTITPAERRFIEVIAELHATRVDVDTLASIAPGEVAEAITEPHRRKRVLRKNVQTTEKRVNFISFRQPADDSIHRLRTATAKQKDDDITVLCF